MNTIAAFPGPAVVDQAGVRSQKPVTNAAPFAVPQRSGRPSVGTRDEVQLRHGARDSGGLTDFDLPSAVVTVDAKWAHGFLNGRCTPSSSNGSSLVVRGAVLRGTSHAATGDVGQDVVGAVWCHSRDRLYLAVADGLGSLEHSGRTAADAVRGALGLCRTMPADVEFADAGPRLFKAIADGLAKDSEVSASLAEGATTLLVAEIRPTASGSIVTVHGVGDSEAWVLRDGLWGVLIEEGSTGADNATREMPGDPRPISVKRHELRDGDVFLMMTDGFARPMRDRNSGLAGESAGGWQTPPDPIAFVRHISSGDARYADDRGVMAVWIEPRGRRG